MDSLLIAKVLVPKTNGKNAIGTAYPISKSLIITARHVVDFAERDTSKPISITWTDENNNESYTVQVPQKNIVFNGEEKYDVVLIRCNLPLQREIRLPILTEQYPKTRDEWESWGYPQIGKEEDGSRQKVSAMGEIFPSTESSSILDLESKGDAEKKEGWQGISGAPVFVGETLVAVITHTPNDIKERLRSVSIAYLLQHEQAFKELIYGSSNKKKYSPDPSFLPYLLDRKPQEDDLIDAIAARHDSFEQPLLCIIRGSDDDCCSDRFVERIARHVLPQVPATKNKIKDDNYRVSFIETGDFKNAAQLHRSMLRSLGESFTNNKTASLDEINAALGSEKRPVLLYATLSTEDCQNSDGAETLQHFLSFWQNWQGNQRQNHLILVCLFFYHEPCKNNFFGRILGKKDLNTQIEEILPKLDCTVLPKLEPIKDKHIKHWSESDDVRNFFRRSIYGDVCEEVKKIYLQQKSEEIALGHLARKLIPLLNNLSPKP